MLTIHNLSYIHPDKELLFSNINATVAADEKIALIGNNGSGKSTLLKIITGILEPAGGVIRADTEVYYVPQIFGQYNHLTIAEAVGVDRKLKAFYEILNGSVSEKNYDVLNDDWEIEERCAQALKYWKLSESDLAQPMETLSGGQKTKVLLAGILIHTPQLVLLDEPSNHLDFFGRGLLYDFIQSTKSTLLIVSHDRKLLNLLNRTYELSKHGIKVYGGNYDFYTEQKKIEGSALDHNIQAKERALKKAKEKERETIERQQKLDTRGRAKQEKSGVARIMMNTLRNSAEKSTAKLKGVHTEKISDIKQELQELRASVSDIDQMKFGFDNSKLHNGKNLFVAEGINFRYENKDYLWDNHLDLKIVSGERIVIKGANGSGKTTLINLILGNLTPSVGTVVIASEISSYIDQDYSLIKGEFSVYEQAQEYNTNGLLEHEVKIRLNRFLFDQEQWTKPCHILSGGERMRLALCCLSIGYQSPDIIILDEPTNNLDIQNIEILTHAINGYQGTLLVVSHDEIFLNEIRIERAIEL